MKRIRIITMLKSVLYGAMIAFAAHVGEAIPFPYHEGIAELPVAVQTGMFFLAGALIFFVCVTAKQLHDEHKQKAKEQ